MADPNPWFTADKEGLRDLMARRRPGWRVGETLQNPWDEDGVTRVQLTLRVNPERPGTAILVCVDDSPTGFRDLSHAYTLFARSYKATDPGKRGRFNLGEKLVLATAIEARISSTTGVVVFDHRGRRLDGRRKKRDFGTEFWALLEMTPEEVRAELDAVKRFIPPENILTCVNGETLVRPEQHGSFKVTLPTMVASPEGPMRRTRRVTQVAIYTPPEGAKGFLYEMGIPVVETGDRWSYDVDQKVPIAMERNNVPPSYLRDLRTKALEHLHERLTPADAAETWVSEAVASPRISEEAFNSVMDKRFGTKRFMWDPSDREANNRATAAGWTPVRGRQLSAGIRENRKRFQGEGRDPLPPAGRLPRFSTTKETIWGFDLIAPPEMNPDVREVVAYIRKAANLLIGHAVTVEVINEPKGGQLADYRQGDRRMRLNQGTLGLRWFNLKDPARQQAIDDLMIHELGHEYEGNHLSKKYNDALSRLGAKLAHLIRSGLL